MGWGVDGITPVPVGGPTHTVAAVETGKVEGGVASTEMTLQLERDKRLKQIYNFAKLVPHFITHVIEARKDLVKDKPDMVRRFVAAWFETTEWMYGHKKESVQISAKVLKQPEDLMAKIYDFEMPEFSHTGKFEPEAVALLKESFIEQKRLDKKPADNELFTEEFLPKKKAVTH
jgi:ABC-type nitrate/sulfonate/bicarbonate transport system substrate-binding protein